MASDRGNTSALRQTLTTSALLLAMRIIRSWNQTGQKFAGEPDIVKTYVATNPVLLWCLVGATYVWVHRNLVYGLSGLPIWLSFAGATGLVLAAFTFKVAFTLEDAPELVTEFVRQLLQLNFTQGADLVSRARAAFIGIGLAAGGVVGCMLVGGRISRGQSGMLLPLIYPLFCLLSLRASFSRLFHPLLRDNQLPSISGFPSSSFFPSPQCFFPFSCSLLTAHQQLGTATLLTLLTLLLLTQSRTTNIPLFLLFNLQFRLLSSSSSSSSRSLTPLEISTTALLLQHASFFAAGGTNAVSSVDLSSAYNGVAEYHPLPVGVLTFLGNWAGPVWWAVAAVVMLLDHSSSPSTPSDRERARDGKEKGQEEEDEENHGGWELWKGHVAVLTVFAAGSVAAVMAACTVLRTHLFVWTVFSPKYLYCAAWSLGQHLLVNVGLGGVVWGLGLWERRRLGGERE